MKFRTAEYLRKSKARKKMQHPGDLKSFLKAEMDICNSGVVKKHIQKTLEALDAPLPVTSGTAAIQG